MHCKRCGCSYKSTSANIDKCSRWLSQIRAAVITHKIPGKSLNTQSNAQESMETKMIFDNKKRKWKNISDLQNPYIKEGGYSCYNYRNHVMKACGFDRKGLPVKRRDGNETHILNTKVIMRKLFVVVTKRSDIRLWEERGAHVILFPCHLFLEFFELLCRCIVLWAFDRYTIFIGFSFSE